MATTPVENSKVADMGRQVSQLCLGIPTILRHILDQISTSELITLSLVNKLWNYEARSVMRKRGNLRANIEKYGEAEHEPCKKLVALASQLSKMRVVPFNGIHIDMCHNSDCQWISSGSLSPSYKVILDRLPWKHFSVNFCDGWDDCSGCPALVLVKKILEDNCGVLEELTLGFGKEGFLRNAFQDRSLPCLKTLTVDKGNSSTVDEPLTSAFIKALVSRAPRLQELRVKGELNFMENVLEGSSAVLVPTHTFCPLFEPICESLVGSLMLDRMEIRIQNENIGTELLNRFIPMLLQASRTTLKTLSMDLLFAVPLMCYRIFLENVTTLVIELNGCTLDYMDPAVLALLKGLDFTRLFPKLNQVTILDDYNRNFSMDVVSSFVEQGNEVLMEVLPDRAINIKRLKFYEFYSIEESTLSLLAQIFPHVKRLEMNATPEFPFTTLREHFVSLEEVTEVDSRLFLIK